MLALALLLELQQHYERRAWFRWPVRITGFFCALYLLGTNMKDTWLYATDYKYQAEIEQAKRLPPGVVIVSERTDFMRRSERDVFINQKFIPNSADRICEWQRRRELLEQEGKRIVFVP